MQLRDQFSSKWKSEKELKEKFQSSGKLVMVIARWLQLWLPLVISHVRPTTRVDHSKCFFFFVSKSVTVSTNKLCHYCVPFLTLIWYPPLYPHACMMTSSNWNICRVTGHLCGEFTGPRWISRTNASDAGLWCFFDLRLNKRLRRQSWGWWFETLLRPLWRHCNGSSISRVHISSVIQWGVSPCWPLLALLSTLGLVITWYGTCCPAKQGYCDVILFYIWTPVPISICFLSLIVFSFMV